jgi:hypothetical protein
MFRSGPFTDKTLEERKKNIYEKLSMFQIDKTITEKSIIRFTFASWLTNKFFTFKDM